MARPRKSSTNEMLRIVESYFESSGDPNKLKCSLLEEYALSLGFEVKAYDFRRNEAVRKRMEELRTTSRAYSLSCIAYKSLDVDALLNRNYTHEMLRNSLLELDETWRPVYERAAVLSRENAALLSALSGQKNLIQALTAEKESLSAEKSALARGSSALALENRYLRSALKKHLYPAIANEILRQENVLEQTDTMVMPDKMTAFADTEVPSSFSGAVGWDRQMLSREENIMSRLTAQIRGEDDTQNTYD